MKGSDAQSLEKVFVRKFNQSDRLYEAKEDHEHDNSSQFDVSDTRTVDQVINWLIELGYIPSFCTACYRSGRTGDRFMKLVKSAQIGNCCTSNALMTLDEYLQDYAEEDTKEKGLKLIAKEAEKIENESVRNELKHHLEQIANGQRDFRF